jgi:dipeptidyl aminopeptidase/acylaminoacyl peptidase
MTRLTIMLVLIVALVLLAGCGPDQLFGPTATPTPTSTPTATPQPTFAPTQMAGPMFDFIAGFEELDTRLRSGGWDLLIAPDAATVRGLQDDFEQLKADLEALDVPDSPEAERLVEAGIRLADALIQSAQNNDTSWVTAWLEYISAHADVLSQVEPPPADTEVDLGGGKLLFMCNPEGDYEICVMNADRRGRQVITSSGKDNYFPRWSPDGTQIVFYSYRDDITDVYVIDADGTNEVNLTDGQGGNDPDWSPDGTQIIFTSGRDTDDNFQLYVMNADGSEATRLTDDEGSYRHPAWSPDGEKIAFSFTPGEEDDWDIYVMNSDGTEVVQLTDNDMDEVGARWSPDGSLIAFIGSVGDEDTDIYLMNADGSEVTQLTDNDRSEVGIAWSPDGTWLLFTSDPMLNREIYVMALSNGGVAPLTSSMDEDEIISDWLP